MPSWVKAPTVARLQVMRLGATRLAYAQPVMHVVVGGVARTHNVRVADVSIRDMLGGTPNTALLRVWGFVPQKGQEIALSLGHASPANTRRIFGGHILGVTQVTEGGRRDLLAFDINCISYEWLLNRHLLTGRYLSESASSVVADIIERFTTGFTMHGLEPNLPVLDEMTFTQEVITSAFDRIAFRIGGSWYVDYNKDLHFFLNETTRAHPIDDTSVHTMADLVANLDLSQVRTRIWQEGGGSNALVDIEPGDATIPLEDGAWYQPGGGMVMAGPQRIVYGGTSPEAGTGTAVAGIPLDPPPILATVLQVSGRLRPGTYRYVVSFLTTLGESNVVGASAAVGIIATILSPPTALTATALSVSGNLTDTYDYRVTFVTTSGETLPGPASAAKSIPGVSKPSTPSISDPLVLGNLDSTYRYEVTYLTASGETAPSSASNEVGFQLLPTVPFSVVAEAGPLPASTTWGYVYQVTTYGGSVEGNIYQASVGPNFSCQMKLTLPATSDPRASGRRIYRRLQGGGAYRLLASVGLGAMTYTDTTPDATLASGQLFPVSPQLAAGQMDVTLPKSGDARVTKRRVYRQDSYAGGGYKLVTTINDNTSTSYRDNVAAGSLGGPPPGSSSALGGQMSLTAIPTSPDGRVTSRKIYRHTQGHAEYRLCKTLTDNITTTHTDNLADASLGELMPDEQTVDLASSGQITLANIPIGPDTTTARKLYRTPVNGTDFRALVTIRDNLTTTYLDNKADADLGDDAPARSDIGAGIGDTALRVDNLGALPNGGWLLVGNQVLRFASKAAPSGEGIVSGIPASGRGAIVAKIPAGAPVINAAFLVGIAPDQVVVPLKKGEPVNLLVMREDLDAQAALGALIGGDGVFEEFLQDNRLSHTEAENRAEARLQLVKDPLVTARYTTRDQTTRTGADITITLGPPTNLSGTFKVQSVSIQDFDARGVFLPRRTVEASSRRLTFEALLRLIAHGDNRHAY